MSGISRRVEQLERKVRRREEDLNRPCTIIYVTYEGNTDVLSEYLALQKATNPARWARARAAVELADPFAEAERAACAGIEAGGLCVVHYGVHWYNKTAEQVEEQLRQGREYLDALRAALETEA